MLNENTINLLRNASLAFRFDFFSDIDRRKIAKNVIKYTKIENVSFSNEYKEPNTLASMIRVCRNDAGGSKMTQFQVNYLPYFEASRRGMHHHAPGLHHHGQVPVLIQDLQRNILRLRRCFLRRRYSQDDLLSLRDLRPGLPDLFPAGSAEPFLH